ncbi:MAG TPA: hypothetical protein VGN13_03000 [Solirubrobacteraceae bacterium]|jgi:hypothetical protein
MSSVDDFFAAPAAELVDKLKQLHDQRANIESREEIIEQLLEVRAKQGGEVAAEIAALGAAAGIGPLREQILHVMETKRAEDVWVMAPMQVHDELTKRGNRSVKLDAVRVAMTRMAEKGDLERPRPNVLSFALPGVLDAIPAAFREAVGLPPR